MRDLGYSRVGPINGYSSSKKKKEEENEKDDDPDSNSGEQSNSTEEDLINPNLSHSREVQSSKLYAEADYNSIPSTGDTMSWIGLNQMKSTKTTTKP